MLACLDNVVKERLGVLLWVATLLFFVENDKFTKGDLQITSAALVFNEFNVTVESFNQRLNRQCFLFYIGSAAAVLNSDLKRLL